MSCQCKWCERYKIMKPVMERMESEGETKFLEALDDLMQSENNYSTEAGRFQMILEGNWPNSDDILLNQYGLVRGES